MGDWGRLGPEQRGKLLYRLADLLEREADRPAELETLCNGRPIREMRAQPPIIPSWYRYFAGMVDKLEGQMVSGGDAWLNDVIWVSLGVVAQITPWNHPLLIGTKKIAPALAAGERVGDHAGVHGYQERVGAVGPHPIRLVLGRTRGAHADSPLV
ncbi:MAG: hypothetical protein C4303_01215 [candidate division GAL15 bacterium]